MTFAKEAANWRWACRQGDVRHVDRTIRDAKELKPTLDDVRSQLVTLAGIADREGNTDLRHSLTLAVALLDDARKAK